METNKRLKEQIALTEELLNTNGYNLVTCSECGCTNIVPLFAEELTCFDCRFTSEPCDFPDLFY